MKLRRLLIEITFDDAVKVLSIDKSDISDESKLKLAFRTAALKSHPDKGGSNEAMRDVNDAYEFLKKHKGSASGTNKFDWEQSRKEYINIGLKILEILKSTLNYNSFTSYFENIYGEPFSYKIISERPKSTETSTPHYATLNLEFANNDRGILFLMEVSCDLNAAKRTSSLGSGAANISYSLLISAFGFFNNKKMKITQRDYTRTQNHDILTKPEISFPKAKLEKFKKTSSSKVFKRADMLAYLTRKLSMSWDGEDARLPKLPDNIVVVFRRAVFMKMPYWSLLVFQDARRIPGIKTISMNETEETAQSIERLVKKIKNMTSGEEIKTAVTNWSNETERIR